jgi:hypothetical protein
VHDFARPLRTDVFHLARAGEVAKVVTPPKSTQASDAMIEPMAPVERRRTMPAHKGRRGRDGFHVEDGMPAWAVDLIARGNESGAHPWQNPDSAWPAGSMTTYVRPRRRLAGCATRQSQAGLPTGHASGAPRPGKLPVDRFAAARA